MNDGVKIGFALIFNLLLLFFISVVGIAPARGGGSWTPRVGTSDRDIAHGEEVEEEFREAVAILTSGFTRGGIRQLRRLKKRHPGADWVEDAFYYIGLGYFQLGNNERAFEYFGRFVRLSDEAGERVRAQQLRLECARKEGERGPGEARPLFDTLLAEAEDEGFEAEVRWELAGVFYRQEEYRGAVEAYFDFVDHHPRHGRVPDAWFRVARSRYHIASRIDRGRQYLNEAKIELKEFLEHFPDHQRSEEAGEMLEGVRRRRGERIEEVAEFYLKVRNRPHAALDYFHTIVEEFPDTSVAERARSRIKEIEQDLDAPASGNHIPLKLKGVKERE